MEEMIHSDYYIHIETSKILGKDLWVLTFTNLVGKKVADIAFKWNSAATQLSTDNAFLHPECQYELLISKCT